MTVNRALRELTAEGELERVAGVGTFVAEGKPQSNLLMIAHIRDEIRSRARLRLQGHHAGSRSRVGRVAAAFGLPMNTPVFHLTCVHLENGRPIQFEDRYVNPAAAPNFLTQDFTAEPPSQYLYNNVSHYELEIEHIVDACLPTPEQAALLEMRTDEPCLMLTRRTWTDGTPVTLAHFVHAGNRYRLGSRFKPNSMRGQGLATSR